MGKNKHRLSIIFLELQVSRYKALWVFLEMRLILSFQNILTHLFLAISNAKNILIEGAHSVLQLIY